MKTREEMISEIVGEFEKKWWTEWMSSTTLDGDEIVIDSEKVKSFLRSSLLRISDASMDAVEVEKWPENRLVNGRSAKWGWNTARTASQEKRREFIKIS